MKKIYLLFVVLVAIVITSCSKDFLKRYEKRIEGSWRLMDVRQFGFGSVSSPFSNGQFIFSDAGELTYISDAGDTSRGSWNLRKRWIQGNCYSDDNGNRNCDDRYIRTLTISAVNFTNQELRSEYFDDMKFTSTNHFKAFIYLPAGTCVFYFSRQ